MEFLAVTDNRAGAAVVEDVLRDGKRDRTLSHASGRPWLVGTWDDGDVLTVTRGNRSLALLGCFRAVPADLGGLLERATGADELHEALRRIPGSYHAVASLQGQLTVQGSLSGVREVFYATVNGATLAADRPDTLAELAGGGIDERALLGHLMAQPPPPLSERTAWRGVECLKPGHRLRVHPDGSHRTVAWWVPPAPGLPLAEAAVRVRDALTDAVAARTRSGTGLACDLSGGMDSSSLAFLTGRREPGRRWVTVRHEATDPGNDDARWGARAAALLPDAEHLVFDATDLPPSFAGQLDHDDVLEAPYAWNRKRAETLYVTERLATQGVSVRLTGHGGDELFNAPPSLYHALARDRPLRSVSALRAARSMYRWPLGAMLRNLLRNPSYSQWLATASASLSRPIHGPREPVTGWGYFPRLPHWATGDAVDACRAAFDEAAGAGTAPFSASPAQHVLIQAVRQCGGKVRLTDRLTSPLGVAYHAPYLDDRVVEAALSARIADRYDTGQAKPVLATAMRGVVPAPVLSRSTKGEFSAEVYAGVRRYRRDLLALGEDMRLARLGLVDEEAVRTVLLSPHPTSRTFIPMVATLACESWLRSVEAARTRARGREGTR
ncbi:asparagine synthase-related protein [Streptomyces capillispiralis]|uniref:asparagine synthase (glutamine-hydrolyzing) n=1 Tax=Streptomyces capillispiralis TaxID=68182 RepID=A0A561TGR3_9ACTN|nr:asparagine synthase-related protein [Streptomyces capillispiralis]TWF86299.1 asparagine synthase (glutamine-hydrolysing) [Streptomyces capillispiralis]GHH91224.1 asparagine synthase [Streptomyces capillispiralis]